MDHRQNLASGSLYGDSLDNLFPAGNEQTFDDARWGVNASNNNYPSLSRAPSQAAPSWTQNTSHLSAAHTSTNYHTPSDIYGRSPAHSPAPYSQASVYGNYNGANQTYQQPYHQQTPHNLNAFQAYQKHSINAPTIAPQALAPVQRSVPPKPIESPVAHAPSCAFPQRAVANQDALLRAIPPAGSNGRFSTIDFAQLVRATNAERATAYVDRGERPVELPVSRTTALPAYVRRHSRNSLKRLARNDPKLLAKLNSKSARSVIPPRVGGLSAQSVLQRENGIKYEGDSSSNDDSNDDSDVSLYSDEEEATAGAPLSSKRPDDDPRAAVEYDVIKALWRNKKSNIDAQSIRVGLKDFWEVVKTVRDRWKADDKAVKDAEEKKQVGDLPLLKGRVKAQREMIEVAFRTAMKHGFKQIVELFSENQSLLFLCHQFLLDRAKADDYNSTLAHAILELLSLTTSITAEKLDKTFLAKSLGLYLKSGHAKTKFYAKKIVDAAGAAAAKAPAVKSEAGAVAGVKRSATTAGNASTAAAPKRPATNGSVTAAKPNTTVKKAVGASDMKKPGSAATTSTAKPKTVVAKPSGFFGLQSVGKKPGTSNAEKAVTKPADRKPADRKPAANPNAKPAFNLAETLANLGRPREEPKKVEVKPEVPREYVSPEQKAKRAARLARGAVNVRFRDGLDLVEIRIFEHDPAEELDHDASQVRDVKDVGGEGRMLKQHKDKIEVDEDDDSDDEKNTKMKEFQPPKGIDFSTIDREEQARLYAPYGGGPLQPDSPESAAREQYEATTLAIYYTNPSEIPPNPREPADPYNGDQMSTSKNFHAPPEKYIARGRQKLQQKAANDFRQVQNLSSLTGFNPQQPYNPPLNFQAPPAPTGGADIQSLLKTLTANGLLLQPQQQPVPQPPPMQMPAFPGFPPPQPTAPKLSNGEPDLAAILAALNASSSGATAAQPANTAGFPQYQAPIVSGNDRSSEHPFYKTKVCKYWQEGKCSKGDRCSYLHE